MDGYKISVLHLFFFLVYPSSYTQSRSGFIASKDSLTKGSAAQLYKLPVSIASTQAPPSNKWLTKNLGLKVGLNNSPMNFNKGYHKPLTPVESSWKAGFMIGFNNCLYRIDFHYNKSTCTP